jgi:hypothetical protein
LVVGAVLSMTHPAIASPMETGSMQAAAMQAAATMQSTAAM